MKTAYSSPARRAIPGMGKELKTSPRQRAESSARPARSWDTHGEPLLRRRRSHQPHRSTQPAVVTASCAALAAVREQLGSDLAPAAAAGLSLGEYSALVCARYGAQASYRPGTQARAYHGEACPPGAGAMATVLGLGRDAVLEVCRGAKRRRCGGGHFNCLGRS